ncbi:uncharacterized protein DFL_008648 [Arthrobotrys flagrans]|uniref:Uncharacterized protein n=1 Tax=Arthrobotrys flagrans TaxID=97331 RepID=A0A436ZPH6_ARTFL|nr:hypothetical protein DFL_008648 [Arthrobotrys flagrans]
MYQDMLITLSAPSNLLRNQLSSPSQSQPSALPPYTPTPSSHPTKFELSYPPPSPQNPITPIYRSQTLLPPLSDGSPPEYRHSLQTIDSNLKPAYVLHFDESTQNTILKTPEGQTVTSISFLKPRRQTVTTFSSSDVDAQTLAGSSFTLADDDDDEGQDGSHILLHSETLSNGEDDNNDRVQEEVGSILLDTVPAKQTITLSSHKYFHPKGTKFTTPSGNSYRWQKSITASTPPISPKGVPKNTRPPHPTFVLTCSPPKSQRTPGSKRIIGRISISSSKATLELKGGQEELSEAMFLGSAIAVLKKVELKAVRQRVQKTLPQNVVQITF